MSLLCVSIFLMSVLDVVYLQNTGSGTNGNLRLCVVEGRGSYKRAPKYCPILDEENAGVECVIGTDRLDCLRRITKGTVDFGVFSPEDLIAAQWANIEVLVTNELRMRDRPYERSIVAVVNRRILPERSSSLHQILRNTTLCHPGVGVNDIRPMSDTLSGYLESLILERSCDPDLSMTENRIKALAGFFGKACKAGPWIPDAIRDAELKKKYPSLCAACNSPQKCASTDTYWGDTGALTCLVEASGDVTWADLDDVNAYFGITGSKSGSYPSTESFAYLCRDGTWRPLNQSEPCVWLYRPWPVIVAKRKASEAVSRLVESLEPSEARVSRHWQGALSALLEARAPPAALHPPRTALDYLAAANGFREAYSQSGCDPPRHIGVCTTSLLARNKCEWLSEAGAVYGVTPPLQCTARDTVSECLQAVAHGISDVTVADGDWLVPAIRDYSLIPLVSEATPIVEKMNTIVAYVRSDSQITKMADLRGKRAAFSRHDGSSFYSVTRYLAEKEEITCKDVISEYFKEICAPGVEEEGNLKSCYEEGEVNALKSLVDGNSDVAFVSMNTYNMLKENQIPEPWAKDVSNINPLCPEENQKYCFISWSNIGHVLATKTVSDVRRHEIVNVFTKLDQMFGKHPPFHSPMFTMYGPFSFQLNVLFHNNTRSLAPMSMLRMHPYDKIPLNLERSISNVTDFTCSFATNILPSTFLFLITVVYYSIFS